MTIHVLPIGDICDTIPSKSEVEQNDKNTTYLSAGKDITYMVIYSEKG